jgi:hypothetical protein
MRCNQAATFVPRDLDLTPGARCLGVATAEQRTVQARRWPSMAR